MQINNVVFNCELSDVLQELRTQLAINHIALLQRVNDGPDNIQVQCPYHKNGQERRPSAGIRKSDGLFHCMACGETHSLQEVISYCFGHTDDVLGSFGWQWLLKNFATIKTEERKDVNLNFNRGVCVTKQINYVSEDELDSYRYYHQYWEKRGITNRNLIELFDLGYDKKTDCITFPVRDSKGNCLFIARRSVHTKYFSYPAGAEKPLYGLYELSLVGHYTEVIVCESMLDALSFWQIGKYAVALNGTGDELQFKQLRDLPCRKLILATDNDKAGMYARQRIRANVKNKIITEYVFPSNRKDANECTKEELFCLEEIF